MTAEDKPLWAGRFGALPAREAADLSRSIGFDLRLWREEVDSTAAHATMLAESGLLTESDLNSLLVAMAEAASLFEKGEFPVNDADEDVHSALERFLTTRLGDVGAKVHAGRSRNDLVATDLRLWIKRRISPLVAGIADLQDALLGKAEEHVNTVAAGYTHLQRAQPVSLAHLLLAHAFAFARDIDRFRNAHRSADVSVLGAGALAGSTLPLDPAVTASKLGFSSLFDNAADAVSDRDFALEFLFACAVTGIHLSRLGEEIVIWTSAEFGFATLDDSYSTGSSIMPQKKNPDTAELARGKSARLMGNLTSLLVTLKGLPLTYQRDLQEDKEPVFDSYDTVALMLPAVAGMVRTIRFDENRLRGVVEGGDICATDLAEGLVLNGVPFREAHELVGRLVGDLADRGRTLSEIKGDELAEFDPRMHASMVSLLDPKGAVERRDTWGGTSPRRIGEQMTKLRSGIAGAKEWAAQE